MPKARVQQNRLLTAVYERLAALDEETHLPLAVVFQPLAQTDLLPFSAKEIGFANHLEFPPGFRKADAGSEPESSNELRGEVGC